MEQTDQASLQSELMLAAKSTLERLVKTELRQEVQAEKEAQIREIERNERYWRGKHYWAPSLQNGRMVWSPVGWMQGGDRSKKSVNDYVLNYYRSLGNALIGILGKNPNATGVADSARSDHGVAVAAKASQIIEALWPHWQVEQMQPRIVGGLWRQGAQFLHTPFVTSRDRYGVTEVPHYKDQPMVVEPARYECWSCHASVPEQMAAMNRLMCPTCGTRLGPDEFVPEATEMFPVQVGTDEYANGSVELNLYSGLEVTTQFSLQAVDDRCPWLLLDTEQYNALVLAAYPELAEKRAQMSGGSASGYSEGAREARRTSTGYGQESSKVWGKQDWSVTRAWLSAEMLSGLPTPNEAIAKDLKRKYPDGLKATYVNTELVRVEGESLGSVWTHCSPSVGDTIYSEPLGNPAAQMNDAINDGYNIIHQTAQKGIPFNLYDPNIISPQAMKKMTATPADWLPAIPDVSGRLSNAVWSSTPSQLHPATTQMFEMSLASAQTLVAVTPALTGNEQREQTLGEAEMRRNQALLPHNTTWNNIRHAWMRAYTNAIVQFAQNTNGEIHFRRMGAMPSTSVTITDIEDLLSGGWHVEVDEAIPLTWGQRRAQVFQLLERGPDAIRMFQLDQPQNLQTLFKVLGNEDFEIPQMRLREKVMADIRELAGAAPQQGPNGEMIPTVPPDDFEMDHAFWVQVAKEWFNGEEGRAQKKTNMPGYANVLARARAEMGIVNMLNAPPPQPQSGPSGGPPGKSEPQNGLPGINPAPPPSPETGLTPDDAAGMMHEGA